MSYLDERIRTKTEKGRLYDLDLYQSQRCKIEKQLRRKLQSLEAIIERKDAKTAEKEIKTVDELFSQFMELHGKCMMLISDDQNSNPLLCDEFAEKLDKDVHLLKRKYYEWIQSPPSKVPEKQEMDSARSKHSSKSSKKSSARQSSGRQSTKSSRSSIRQAAIEERARIAELKLEAEFMVKQEETIQKQRMLEKELQIAKAEARLQIFEEEEERCSQASKSSISSVSSSKKDEMVRHYVKELPDEVESENEKKQNIIVALPDVPADTQGTTVSKLIDSL